MTEYMEKVNNMTVLCGMLEIKISKREGEGAGTNTGTFDRYFEASGKATQGGKL